MYLQNPGSSVGRQRQKTASGTFLDPGQEHFSFLSGPPPSFSFLLPIFFHPSFPFPLSLLFLSLRLLAPDFGQRCPQSWSPANLRVMSSREDFPFYPQGSWLPAASRCPAAPGSGICIPPGQSIINSTARALPGCSADYPPQPRTSLVFRTYRPAVRRGGARDAAASWPGHLVLD